MLTDPFRRDGPIVTSLADDDFYKMSMAGLIAADPQMDGAQVRFGFKNRTSRVELAHYIREDDIRRELDHARTLQFTETELRYYGGHFVSESTPDGENNRRMFDQKLIDRLRTYRLPPYRLIRENNETYSLETSGPWFDATFWEIHVLQIMAQLYFESLIAKLSVFERRCVWADAERRLLEKVRVLRQHPEVIITDFGTRRRGNLAWQRFVNEVLLNELGPKQFRGTSNVMISMQNHTVPMGTFAHELVMGMSGIMHGTNEEIAASQNELLDRWYAHYGQGLSVALSDTYGSEYFFRTFGPERARLWKGTRQDSGDPFEYGERAVSFYRSHDIDPSSKLIVFSDGLDVDTMIELSNRFRGRIVTTFGWGTNLTNDFGTGFEPLSLIMKLLTCNGHATVKLSDNLAKAMGPEEQVERFKRIVRYKESFRRQPRY